jgi:hypothetical protein
MIDIKDIDQNSKTIECEGFGVIIDGKHKGIRFKNKINNPTIILSEIPLSDEQIQAAYKPYLSSKQHTDI